MQTSDVLKKINIPRHKLYYLEQKGYINPKKNNQGRFRDERIYRRRLSQNPDNMEIFEAGL